MWIMLTKKLPTVVSPPKLSYHWALPWVGNKIVEKQFWRFCLDLRPELRNMRIGRHRATLATFKKDNPELYNKLWQTYNNHTIIPTVMGNEPNWRSPLGFMFLNERLRVFSHEYSANPKSMKEMLEDKALIFHPDPNCLTNTDDPLTPEQRTLFEHALIDGCDVAQATQVALGGNYDDVWLPPTGWYEVRPEYAEHFCTKYEMEITDHREYENV